MCLSKVYVESNQSQELLMEEVASIEIDGGKLLLRTLFGQQKEIEANIKRVDFMIHNVILEDPKKVVIK